MPERWRPVASIDALKQRARILSRIRAFFDARGLYEVETPALSVAATTDPHIESIPVGQGASTRYLHTSPEFPMKRLLAAGSDSIYQICRVFRPDEVGRWHQPEFSMLEWYRVGWDHHQLMDELTDLIVDLEPKWSAESAMKLTYREAFLRWVNIDPLKASSAELAERAARCGIAISDLGEDRDAWLELLFTHVIEHEISNINLCYIYEYPSSQAALSKLVHGDSNVAERFELYIKGVELANGFHELTDAGEQQKRFMTDLDERRQRGLTDAPMDRNLINALEAGMPSCAGVAVGLDRLVALLSGADCIADVMAFPADRA